MCMNVEIYNYGWAKRMSRFLFQSDSLPFKGYQPSKITPFLIISLRGGEGIKTDEFFGKLPKGERGGHFQSKNLYCRFLRL